MSSDLYAHAFQPPLGLAAQLRAHRAENRARALEQDHSGVARIDVVERAFERAVGEFGDLTGQLDAGGARTDDDESQQPIPLFLGVGQFGLFECAEDASA